MKTAMTALAVLMLAGAAAPAFAAPPDEDRAERMDDHDRWHDAGERPQYRPQARPQGEFQRPAEPPRPPEARPAPTAPAGGGDRARYRGDGGQGRPDGARPGWERGDNDRHDDRRDGDGDRRDRDRRDGDRRDGDRRGPDSRGWDNRGWDRDWSRNDRDRWDRDRWDRDGDRRRWERGRYPPVYSSAHRYRYAWRPPSGFYLRAWTFGEFLPRGWYGPGAWIVDPWRYDLPLPPPGYDWVRSGPDALLVDQFTGRIVQVVRDAFWW